jgi:hypothetical protein
MSHAPCAALPVAAANATNAYNHPQGKSVVDKPSRPARAPKQQEHTRDDARHVGETRGVPGEVERVTERARGCAEHEVSQQSTPVVSQV